jgi:hypothetical protein
MKWLAENGTTEDSRRSEFGRSYVEPDRAAFASNVNR